MADKYVNAAGVAELKAYVDGRAPDAQAEGNWLYRVHPDGTFEAWYRATGQTVNLSYASGSMYRSDAISLALPAGLRDGRVLAPVHAECNCAHSGFPTWGMLQSMTAAAVGFYAMSGASRGTNANYTITAYVFGTWEES